MVSLLTQFSPIDTRRKADHSLSSTAAEYLTEIRDALMLEMTECRSDNSVEQGIRASSRASTVLNQLVSLCEVSSVSISPFLIPQITTRLILE